jgi:hypothetical protein
MFESYPDIMEIDDLCEALRIGRNAAYDIMSEGKLKSFKINRVHKIPKQSLIDYINESVANDNLKPLIRKIIK